MKDQDRVTVAVDPDIATWLKEFFKGRKVSWGIGCILRGIKDDKVKLPPDIFAPGKGG